MPSTKTAVGRPTATNITLFRLLRDHPVLEPLAAEHARHRTRIDAIQHQQHQRRRAAAAEQAAQRQKLIGMGLDAAALLSLDERQDPALQALSAELATETLALLEIQERIDAVEPDVRNDMLRALLPPLITEHEAMLKDLHAAITHAAAAEALTHRGWGILGTHLGPLALYVAVQRMQVQALEAALTEMRHTLERLS